MTKASDQDVARIMAFIGELNGDEWLNETRLLYRERRTSGLCPFCGSSDLARFPYCGECHALLQKAREYAARKSICLNCLCRPTTVGKRGQAVRKCRVCVERSAARAFDLNLRRSIGIKLDRPNSLYPRDETGVGDES